jgi:SAM-dependent methyltransferase
MRQLARETGQSAFGSDPDGYHAGRLGYPGPLYDALFARCVPRPDILEIAAGTGLATADLLARDPRSLTLVESDANLAAYLADRFTDPRVTILNGAFPDVELGGQFDVAVTAAAFHWLEPSAALALAKSLLRPGGIWSMWWNSYWNPGVGDPFADATLESLKSIALPPSITINGHYSLDVGRHTQTLVDAGFLDVEHQILRTERLLDPIQMRALYASYSFVRALPAAQSAALLDRLADLVERDFKGHAPNVILSVAYSAVRNPADATNMMV